MDAAAVHDDCPALCFFRLDQMQPDSSPVRLACERAVVEIQSLMAPAHVICFIEREGTLGFLTALWLVYPLVVMVEEQCAYLILSEASPERPVYLCSLVHK